VFCREVFLRLLEVSFDEVPPSLASDLNDYARSFLTSLHVEYMWNDARQETSGNRGGKLGAAGLWHMSVKETNTLQEFDRPCMPTTSAGRVAAPSRVPVGTFEPSAGGSSLTQEQLNHLCSEVPDWANVDAAGVKRSGSAWQLLDFAGGDWGRMQMSWLSLLVLPGFPVVVCPQRSDHWCDHNIEKQDFETYDLERTRKATALHVTSDTGLGFCNRLILSLRGRTNCLSRRAQPTLHVPPRKFCLSFEHRGENRVFLYAYHFF